MIEKHSIYPIVVDYSNAPKRTIKNCLIEFIKDVKEYFKEMKQPINNLVDNEEANVDKNMLIVKTHISEVNKNKLKRHLLLFIDDLDYLDDKWFELLEEFFHFAQSEKVSIVLTARPNLVAAIENYDDRFSLYFSRDVSKIKLNALQVQNVLMTRLAPMLLEKKEHKFFTFVSNLFSNETNPMFRLLKNQGIKNLDELEKINYPFTKKHNSFMKKITNGCIREIFDIAYESLKYILDNPDLEKRVEEGIERTVIGIEGTLRILFDNQNSFYKIIDIHKYKSKKGNSLLFNVLECVKVHPLKDEKFYFLLSSFGHNKDKVDWALNFLNDRANRFIQYKRILPLGRAKQLYLYDEFEITQKGEYYLNLVNYPEYISRCKEKGRSIIDEMRVE